MIMIHDKDINNLLNEWNGRANSSIYDTGYKDALKECYYELQKVLEKSFVEEHGVRRAYMEMLQDNLTDNQA